MNTSGEETEKCVNAEQKYLSSIESSMSSKSVESKEQLNLFTIPEEVQEIVLDHLKVVDLVACAKVCRSWRAGINSSRVWKKWCILESYTPELQSQYSKQLFEDNGDSQIGKWRSVFGWHEDLKSRWRNKKCTKFLLRHNDSHVYCFHSNNNLAVTGHKDSSVTIWSLVPSPFIIAEFRGVLEEFPVASVKTNGNLVIVVQRKLLQVFVRGSSGYELSDLKCFEMGDGDIELFESYTKQKSKFSSWYSERLRAHERTIAFSPLVYKLFKKLLFVNTHHSNLVRVWTLPGSEIGYVHKTQLGVSQILVNEGNLFFVTRHQVTNLLKYNADNQTSSVLLTVPGIKKIIIGNELIVATPSPGDVTLKRIWAYRKGDLSTPIGTRTIAGYCNISLGLPGYVVYSEDTNITVWDPMRNRTVSHFNTGAVVSYLLPSFSSFLLVFISTSLYLWDWKTRERLYQVYNGLSWTGNYARLLWTNAHMILSGGVDHQIEMITFM